MNDYLVEPLHVKWHLTNKCNLNCESCYLPKQALPDVELTDAIEIIHLLKEKKVAHISLRGGEPTEYAHFFELIHYLDKIGMSFSFLSNGINIANDDQYITALASTTHLESIQISLESPFEKENDRVRGEDAFNKVKSAIQKLIAVNIPVIVSMVLSKENVSDLDAMITLCEELQVTELRLIPFMPIGLASSLNKDLMLSFSEIKEITNSHQSDLVNITSYLNVKHSHGITYGCGAGVASVVINTDLTLSACDMLIQYEKTEQSIQNNIAVSFDALWKDDPIFSEWRDGDYLAAIKCGKCALFEKCGGYV